MIPQTKEEYDSFINPKTEHITFKDRMIKYLLKMRPDYKEWKLRKLSSKQLFLISKSQGL